MLKKFLQNSERGQVIVLIALAMVGLIAIVGLMTDGGMLLIEYAKLKRGIDSAAIGASSQFRKNFEGEDLVEAAREFLLMNESDSNNIILYRCRRDPNTGTLEVSVDGTIHDETLCTTPRRKLLRVEATRTVGFGFLRVIGIQSTTITANSVGEAASIDMVMVIDNSSSMAFEGGGNPSLSDSPLDDPAACNPTNTCQPFAQVKQAALDFLNADLLFFPYDRVAVVTTAQQPPDTGRTAFAPLLHLSDDFSEVTATISNMKVYQPQDCPTASGSCLNRVGGVFTGLYCTAFYASSPNNPSTCTASDIGTAMIHAGNEFAIEPIRMDSVWVVVAMIGGPANASYDPSGTDPDGYCPTSTWAAPPFCRDLDPVAASLETAHLTATRHAKNNASYDADDWARDGADYVADPDTGQGASIFSICIGSYCQGYPSSDPASAEHLAYYMAEVAGGVNANHGLYYLSPSVADLEDIFLDIASNIITRISQ